MDYADLSPQNAHFVFHTRQHGIIPSQNYFSQCNTSHRHHVMSKPVQRLMPKMVGTLLWGEAVPLNTLSHKH